MQNDKTKMERYQDFQAMVQKEVSSMFPGLYAKEATKYGVAEVPIHSHNGIDSPRIPSSSVVPGLRAMGSVQMSQDDTVYTLGLNFNASSVLFYGVAVHRTAGVIDIRADVTGNAQLGPSYYFQPQSSTSVNVGGPIQRVVQSSSAIVIDSSVNPPVVRTTVSNGHLVSVEYPSGTVVARATIEDYQSGSVFVLTDLASGWEIIGNFVVT